jgi:imidazoleglycerol-phosphate dehydratase
MTARTTNLERNTKETNISLTINLDGTGVYEITTGIGFFDHMLEQLSKHSGIDLSLKVTGDLHIDGHHTVEDTGIVLGQAFRKAIGDKKGIHRFGHAYVPMDETLTRVALDLSGRPWFVWRSGFSVPSLGALDTELIPHFFQSFATHAMITLHIETLYGDNNHHISESCFKGLARALKMAIHIGENNNLNIPSTKGML